MKNRMITDIKQMISNIMDFQMAMVTLGTIFTISMQGVHTALGCAVGLGTLILIGYKIRGERLKNKLLEKGDTPKKD